jgi:putative ABC transport system ATP-binding protein
MIVASSLSRHYGSGNTRVAALDNVSFSIAEAEKVAFLGRSGSGKSTLLNLLAAMDSPSSGSLTVNGTQPAKLDAAEKAAFRLHQVGVVFQSFQLIPQRTAAQNVELPLILAGTPASERRDRVHALLKKVGLEKRVNHRPWQLSGGEQQRVSIARAMVNEPPIVLADEPTGNLDTQNAKAVMDLMLELIEANNATLFLITHDQSLAKEAADRVETLRDGRLVTA